MDDGSGAVSGAGIHSATHAEAETMAIRRSLMTDQYELIEALDDLVHDVAKYMVFEVRFLAPDASDAALREAVFTDVCRTRTVRDANGMEHSEPAWVLWRRMVPTELKNHPLAQSIDAAMNHLAALPWGDPAHDWRAVAAAVRQTSDDIRGLSQHVRNAEEGGSHGDHSGH